MPDVDLRSTQGSESGLGTAHVPSEQPAEFGNRDFTAEPKTTTHLHPSSPESPHQWIEGTSLAMVVFGVTLAAFVMLMDFAVVSTAVPRITNDFHSLEDVGWYGSAYTISSAALQTLAGKVYTYFKSKWSFLIFFAIFEAGSLICALATSSKMLIVGRAVSGMGSSGILNGGLNILAGAVPMARRPAMLGIVMGIAQLGIATGPLLGGAFTTYSTWRWCFYVNLPLGGVVLISLIFTRIPEQRNKSRTREMWRASSFWKDFDLIGFFFFASASVQLLLALDYGGNQFPWRSETVTGLFCGSGATFVVLILWERLMGDDAMIPGHLIQQRIVWCSCLLGMVVYGSTVVLSFYLPIYFQAVRGKSAVVSGVDLLPNILCQLVMAVGSGILTSKLGYYLPWGVLGAVLNMVGVGLLSTLSPTTPIPNWAGYEALAGFGRGAAMQVPMVAIQNAVSPDEMSASMAMLTFSQTFGGAIFLATAEAIFTRGLRSNLPRYAPSVDVEAIIAAGATEFRSITSHQNLPGVLRAYSKSIDWVFYVTLGLGGLQFILSWGVGWKTVKKQETDVDNQVES